MYYPSVGKYLFKVSKITLEQRLAEPRSYIILLLWTGSAHLDKFIKYKA